MPLALTTAGGKERAGYTYSDETGVAYEYPRGRYERWIVPGERFVYHSPGQGYTGLGVIGAVVPSKTDGRLICEVLDYLEFPRPVALTDGAGEYFEADPTVWSTGNVYWAQGVRPLADDRFDSILKAAEGAAPATKEAAPPVTSADVKDAGYASSRTALEVEAYSMEVALLAAAAAFPGELIEEMPHNNPGFDIRVGPALAPVRYIEVKGTQSSEPLFFLSEGERAFSETNAATYTFMVVVGVNLKARAHAHIRRHDGQVDSSVAVLKTSQWRGRLI